MITTPSMGLKRWDQPNDVFSYTELSDNFALIDSHDHSSGKGVQVPTGGIANLAVDNTKLANDSVDASKIAANAVGTAEILNGAVTSGKLGFTPVSYQQGSFASRPAAGTAGRVYRIDPTDVSVDKGRVFLDNGTNWESIEPHQASLGQTSTTSVPNGAWTPVALFSATELGLTLATGTGGAINSRYTVTTPLHDRAVFHASWTVEFAANATGVRGARIVTAGGSTDIYAQSVQAAHALSADDAYPGAGAQSISLSTSWRTAPMEFHVYQSSGAAMTMYPKIAMIITRFNMMQ